MAGPNKQLPRVKPGEAVSAEAWNMLVDAINRARIMPGQDCGLDVQYTPYGTMMRVAGGDSGQMRLAKTSSAITARSGTTAGTGTATIQEFDGTSISATTEADIDVYNYSAASGGIATGKYCWVATDLDGYWWIVSTEC